MAAIFFVLGFITNFNMALKDQVQATFDLSATTAQLVNGVFFFAYFCFSLLCGSFIKKRGYRSGIIAGLLLIAIGSWLFYPAVSGTPSYPMFLGAIFIMATGVVFLQTAANPYVVALGPQETASARLNLVQSMNSIATTVAPFLVGLLILTPASLAMGPKAVQLPFAIIGTVVALVAIGIGFIKLPEIRGAETVGRTTKRVWQNPGVILGAIGIFCYVGAEVGCSTQIVPYLEAGGFAKDHAGRMVAIYWAGGMVGRFLGAVMLGSMERSRKLLFSAMFIVASYFIGWFIFSSRVADGAFTFDSRPTEGLLFAGIALFNFVCMSLGQGRTGLSLAIFGVTAAGLVLATIGLPVSVGMWTLLSVGFFNSIMFPSIFSLAVRGVGSGEMPLASGIINTLIVGGAVVPLAMGWLTDNVSVRGALVVPALCFAYIAFFALRSGKIKSTQLNQY
jgi:FHS family L-fucose permease-like MFS transporter